MISKIKTLAAAAALAAMPMMASASTVILVEGGASNDINLADEYGYAEVISGNAADMRIFQLDATPPSQIELAAEFVTLEFTGDFQDLVISVMTDVGEVFATMSGMIGNAQLFDLETVFNSTNGFSQELRVSWSGILDAEGDAATASFNIQAVPSQVPVPAAGLLLLGALGGVAGMRRRAKKAA